MQLKVIISYLFSRVSRNIIYWLLITAVLHSSGGILFPNYVALLLVMLISYGIPGYINNLWLIPRFLLKRRYLTYILLFAVLLVFTTIGSFYETNWVNHLVPGLNYMGAQKDVAMPYHAFPSMLMFAFLAFGKFTTDVIQNQNRIDQFEKQKLKTELTALRSQINPHFLFNALNTIYGMARKNDTHTADAVIKLSDILRHGLYQGEEDEIRIDQEIYFLEQYIEFARLRMHNKNCITFTVNAEIAEQKIAPLLLIPFVENAIKHGVSIDTTNSWVDIHFSLKQHSLSFKCDNSRFPDLKPNKKEADRNGIGLKNVKRRLELLYEHKHELTITHTPEQYTVELNIQLS